MSRETWNFIKQSKRFYVNTYRRAGSLLFFSVACNIGLGLAIYYEHSNQPEHNFYATSGVTPPIQLTPMSSANNTSAALLAADPVGDNENKVIPQ